MEELPERFPANLSQLSSVEGMFDFESGSQELINKLENKCKIYLR